MRPVFAVVATVIAFAGAACGGGGRDDTISVADAAGAEGQVAVEGHLLLVEVPPTPPRLCSALTDHVPPRCDGASIQVSGITGTLPTGEMTPDGSHVWTSDPVVITGSVENGVLHATQPPQPRGG